MAEVWRWWPQSIAESLEFETDVRMAPGRETRDSLKDATQFLTLNHTLQHARAEAMIGLVRANALGEWLVPEWPNATVSTGTLAAAATVIPVAVPAAYRVGQQVFIGLDADRWEARTVASLGASSITISAGLGQAYIGSVQQPVVVAPLVLSIAPNGVDFQTAFRVQGLAVRFMSIDPVDVSANPYPLHAGVPLVTDGAVPFQPLAGALNQSFDLMASGFGAYALQEAEDFVRRRGMLSWYDKGPAARWARRQFLHFLRGRDGEFWMPTGKNDLALVSAVSAGALTITVRPTTTAPAMAGQRIVLREGANVVIREVTGAVVAGPNQTLTIAAPGVAFTTEASVSLAFRSRLDADTIDLSYQFVAGGLASFCTVPTVEVP